VLNSMNKKKKNKLVLFDKLQRKTRENGLSTWTGEKNKKYIFKRNEQATGNLPLTFVFIGQKYFTGIFKTKEKDVYSGDIKEIDGKRYLLFKVTGESKDKIEIYEKVALNT
jgi:hypothetical protein